MAVECECMAVYYTAGVYTQGGGHWALASKYGLAADQVLEWEVVDGQGQPDSNMGLYSVRG